MGWREIQGDRHYSVFILLGKDVSVLEETCSKTIQVWPRWEGGGGRGGGRGGRGASALSWSFVEPPALRCSMNYLSAFPFPHKYSPAARGTGGAWGTKPTELLVGTR